MAKKMAIVLTSGFADWEYALIAGVGGPFYGLDVAFFAPQAGKLRSQGGLTVTIEKSVDELADWLPDVIVVVGGTLWETERAPDISALLNEQFQRGATLAGICGGTLALARAGLLNDRGHTSNDAEFLTRNVEGYTGPRHFVASATAVVDDRVITAPGSAPVSFTTAVFRGAGLDEETLRQFSAMLAAEHASFSVTQPSA
ncbi:DJ-1/PfpI family protein [Serratia marcescens]|nr:DJ-1/PfpI family protein [Serratia marcescens]ELQ9442366.1 DJ-1/PfpI family protein [Serratia marcescens]ELT5563126.1 DJ-1/PfpI family protein [Serratia marcescens]